MMSLFTRSVLLLLSVLLSFTAPLFAQSLQPSKTGLPGRTVWALTTSATGSGAARQMFTFAATDKGLWKSADNGGVWTEVPALKNQDVFAVKARQVGTTTTLLAATKKGIMRSQDGGTTWASPEVTTGTVGSTSNILELKKVFDIEIVNSTWYAATEKGVFRSTNDGRSWTLVNIDRSVDNNEVRGITAEGSTIIVNLWKEGLWRSTNNGSSWAKLSITGETSLSKTVSMVSGTTRIQRGNTLTTATVSMMFVGAVSGNLWRSVDNGTTWTKILAAGAATRLSSNAPTGIDAMTSLGTRIIGGTPNGLALSDDYGASWNLVQTSIAQPVSILAHEDKRNITVGIEQTAQTTALEKNTASVAGTDPGAATFTVASSTTQACPIHVTGFTPASVPVGTQTRDIIINGQNFPSSNSTRFLISVYDEATNYPFLQNEFIRYDRTFQGFQVTYQSPTSVILTVPSSWMTQAYRIGVSVDYFGFCSTQGGGYTFYVGNPPPTAGVPTLTQSSISPFLSTSTAQPITLTGTNFISGTTKVFYSLNGGTRTEITPITVNSATSIALSVPAAALSATGTLAFTAENSATTVSAPLNVAVNYPVPTLTGPTTPLLRTGVAQSIMLTGTNFVSGTTKVYYSLNGGTRTEITPITVNSASSIGLTVPLAAFTATGTIAFTAENVAGSPSAALNVLVHNPLPTIQSVSPLTYARNTNNPITITGTGFVPETRVRLDNSTGWLTPTYLSPTQVRFSALSQYNTGGLYGTATSFQLLVDNPLSSNNQGGGVSANVTIPIENPVPSLSTINPVQIFTGQQATIALSASYLMANTVAQFNNKTYTIAPAGFSPTAIIIPPEDLTVTGSYPITLFTPAPGGGTSQQVYVSVVHPQPFVSSIAPTTVNAGRDTTVTLTGYSFISGASVYIENVAIPLVTTFLSGTSLRAVVPANRIPTNGTYRFYVVNPTPNGSLGGTSGFVDLTVNTPVANLTGITPTTLTASAAAQTLTLSGTLFEANAVAWISGAGITTRALTTTVQHGALATATIPADIAGRAGTYTITLKNPNAPDSQTQPLTVQNPAPTLQSLNPASTLAGSNGIALTLKGTNFVQGAVVVFNGTPLTPSAVHADSITVSIPSSALAVASSVQVLVRNPAPSAGDSPALPFAINNPFPRLDSATAHPLMGGMLLVSTQATTVTLYGGNFILASQVKENGGNRTESTLSSQRLTQGTMTTTIPVEMTAQAGTVRLLVENPTPGGGRSQALTLPVINPAPRADRITPNVLVQPSSDLTLIITGDRFVAGAEVLVNNLPVTVSQNTPTRLTVNIPAERIAERGQYVVVVRNSQTTTINGTPDGGVSTPLTFTVNTPQALVTGITLNGSASGQVPLDTVDVPLVVTGSRFLDSAIVRITGPNNASGTLTVSVATTSLSANEIRALLPASVLNRGGVYTVTVQNPAPTEAVSTSFTFAVVNPAPVVDSIAPRSVQPSLSTQNSTFITVFGTLFTPTSVVRWRGQDLPTQFVSRYRLTASLPATPAILQTLGGVGAVTVFTPTDGVTFMGNEVGGGTGSAQGALGTLLVSHAVPSLTTLTQTTVVRDAWATQTLPTLSMTGELFASNATVRLVSADSTVNTSIPFSSQTPTNLAAQLPRSLMAKTGIVRVRVQNAPAFTGMFSTWLTVPDGGLSEERFFTMVNPTPTLSNSTPTAVQVSPLGTNPATALALSGTNFIPESILLVNGRVWTRTVVSALSMTASLPDSLFTLSGYVRVQIVNPPPVASGSAADSSNVLHLEIFNPVPTLTAAQPVFTMIAGRTPSDSVTITLTGTNFVRNSIAGLALTTAGSPIKDVPTTFRSRDTLLVRLLAADWKAAAYNMTVLNPTPRGGTSVARRFTVTAPAPVLTALLPASTTATGKAWTLTLTGRFFTATSQVSYRNTLQSLTNTTYIPGQAAPVTDDTLRVKLTAVPVGDTTFPVVVYNPPTGGLGGGTSDTLRLAVGLPVPQISSLSPASTTSTLGVKERRGVLVVNGSFFDDAAKVVVQGQAVATEFVSTTRLRAYLPDSMLAVQARRTVQVRNTPVLVSNLVNFTVQNPPPVLTTLTPSTITAGRDTVLVLTGDKFAPDASVALIYGSTVTQLTVIRRDSVLSLQVRVPDTLITRRGAYTVRVNNRPLALDTTNVGGGSDTYALTVIAAPIARVEVSGTDTLMNAGDRSAFITLRFRDPSGNLVDADPVSVSFAAALDTSLPVMLRPTPATGTFPVVRLSIGTYRLDTLRFYQSGVYTLRIDTSVTGAVPVLGPTHFVVRPLADASADMTGLRGTGSPLPAGDTLPSVTVVLKDKFGNFTDNSTQLWSFDRTTGVPAGGHTFTSTATVRSTRLGTGYYRLEATQVVGAGLYTYSLAGAGTGFVYNGERTALVTPLTAVNTDFANLRDSIVAGGRQSKVQVIFSDRYRNRTDVLLPEQRSLLFSNSGDSTVLPSEAFTQSEALTQRTVASGMYAGTPVLGVYDASNAVVVPFAGRYRLSVQRITTTTGTASFVVVPAGDYFVTMTGVKDTITAGEELPAFTVSYRDRFRNPTDNAVGRVTYTHPSGSSTATLPMTRLDEGEYRVVSTVATLAGTYTVGIAGINAANITGNRRFVVRPQIPISAEMTLSTTAMKAGGAKVTITATFLDTFGNPAVAPADAVLENQTLTGVSVLAAFQKTGTIGKYTTTATVVQPGVYNVRVNVKNAQGQTHSSIDPEGNDRFNINPGLGLKATFVNLPLALPLGDTIGAAWNIHVRVTDTLNAPTNHWDGNAWAYGNSNPPAVFFTSRDANVNTHSGLFDLHPQTTFTQTGRYTLSLYHRDYIEDAMGPRPIEIPFRTYAGNRTFDVVPKPVITTISPSVTLASVSPFALTVEGTGFTAASRIVVGNNTQATAQLLSPTMLRVSYVAETAGTLNVKVLSNMTRGVHSAALPLTVVEPYKTALVTVTNIQQVVAGTFAPSAQISVVDEATGQPMNLINPIAQWQHKGATPLPIIVAQAGQTGRYSANCPLPTINEAGTFFMDLSAENARIKFVSPQNPKLEVLGAALARIKVENYLPAPAPLYMDILPGHRQGDTLPAFLIRGYDQFNNLTDIPYSFALVRAASATAPAMTIPLDTLNIWRGVKEILPVPLDSVGEFELVFTPLSPLALNAIKGTSVSHGGAVPLPAPFDEDGKPIKPIRVVPIIREPWVVPPAQTARAPVPVLICANPYIVPVRATSTRQKVDLATPREAYDRFKDEGYSLIWSDEFNGTSLDQTKWRAEEGNEGGPQETYTGEPNFPYGNFMLESNVSVSGGHLKLTAKKEADSVSILRDPFDGQRKAINKNTWKYPINYTNARVSSKFKGDFRYCKVVVSAKVPNVPFMHQGVWAFTAEAGAPFMEVDFPDGACSPTELYPNGNNEDQSKVFFPHFFQYTYLNARHPRMGINVPGVDTGTDVADKNCAVAPDPDERLGLDVHMKKREYWMEWDRDDSSGYISVGVNAKDKDSLEQEQRQTLWGMLSKKNNGAQFIPSNIPTPYVQRDDQGKPVLYQGQQLGKYIKARPTSPPFNQFPYWYYDYFPMHLWLDFQSFNEWAGGYCIVKPINPNRTPGNSTHMDTICLQQLKKMDSLLSNGGQSMEVDYVRVYQRIVSAKDFRPLILNGTQFSRFCQVRLYRTANSGDTQFRKLETRPWNSQEMVALISPLDEDFVGEAKQGFIRVINFTEAGNDSAISLPKRIVFGNTDQGLIRTNRFSHRYASDAINTQYNTPSTLPGNPPRVMGEGSRVPYYPFVWNNYDQLNVELFNVPSLGGIAHNTTSFPTAFSTLPRLPQTRGKWDFRFLDANGQQVGTARTLPASASAALDASWNLEGNSPERNNPNGSEGTFQSVRIASVDKSISNIVTQMTNAQYPNGFYPTCADLIEVTGQFATPPGTIALTAPTDLYDPANICGPFTVRWYLDPKPIIEIVSSSVSGNDNANRSATLNVRIKPNPMIGDTTGSTYRWERQIGRVNDQTNVFEWSAGMPITITTGGANNGSFTLNLRGEDSLRVWCTLTLPQANTRFDRMCSTMIALPVQMHIPSVPQPIVAGTPETNMLSSSVKPQSSSSLASSTVSSPVVSHHLTQSANTLPPLHTIDLLTAPNPAETHVGLRFSLPTDATVTVEVIDALQRVVQTPLLREYRSEGEQTLHIPVGTLSSGVYFVRVSVQYTNGKMTTVQRPIMIVR